jgi:hypothetical protein
MKRSKSIAIGLMIVALVVLPFFSAYALEKRLERPRITLVLIAGHVQLPGGRGLRDVKIHLYEIRDGGQKFVKETITNSEGFYSMRIGGGEKSLWLVPNYAAFGFGEHFDPPEYRFSITSITRTTERNFRYTGPLPDLMIPVYGGSMQILVSGGRCRFGFAIRNSGGLDAGRFKLKVRYWDRSAGYGPRAILEEKIIPHRTVLCSGGTGQAVEGGQAGVDLGPGTAGDESAPGEPLKSASGRYEVTLVELDCEDEVVESIEGNNRFP